MRLIQQKKKRDYNHILDFNCFRTFRIVFVQVEKKNRNNTIKHSFGLITTIATYDHFAIVCV